jgi:ATP-dependent Clp protease adaptor protein ClpS
MPAIYLRQGPAPGRSLGRVTTPIASPPRFDVAIAPERIDVPTGDEELERDRPWLVVVHNDPINLMSYVTYVFQKVFNYSREKAHKLMLQVHNEGKAIVSSGPREKSEAECFTLHGYGLWATLTRDA